jgi:uncharacterized protein YegP (UPF0339 family)
VADVDHIRVYQDAAGEWRWSAIASNGEIVAEGESHARREDARRAAEHVFEDGVKIVEDEPAA